MADVQGGGIVRLTLGSVAAVFGVVALSLGAGPAVLAEDGAPQAATAAAGKPQEKLVKETNIEGFGSDADGGSSIISGTTQVLQAGTTTHTVSTLRVIRTAAGGTTTTTTTTDSRTTPTEGGGSETKTTRKVQRDGTLVSRTEITVTRTREKVGEVLVDKVRTVTENFADGAQTSRTDVTETTPVPPPQEH